MKNLNNNELLEINGGAFNYSLLNAITKALSTIIEFGQQVGSSIRRMVEGKMCSI